MVYFDSFLEKEIFHAGIMRLTSVSYSLLWWRFMPRKKSNTQSFTGIDENSGSPAYIGCAGWSLSSQVQHHFPALGTHLERYASVYSAVEINSSFYRPHRAATYSRWRDSVPEMFRFSVKVPRSITHNLRLRNIDDELDRFLEAAGNLDCKLGCLLVQLPPSLHFEPAVAEQFFFKLQSSVAADIVCEPRHTSWFSAAASDMLAELKTSRVIADPPITLHQAAAPYSETVYIRLHGAPIIYHSSYSENYLASLAAEIENHKNMGRRVWCIFDNTANGAAQPNALFLMAALRANKIIPSILREDPIGPVSRIPLSN
jgi:uncharacterized protein YecE (DUF72 family)